MQVQYLICCRIDKHRTYEGKETAIKMIYNISYRNYNIISTYIGNFIHGTPQALLSQQVLKFFRLYCTLSTACLSSPTTSVDTLVTEKRTRRDQPSPDSSRTNSEDRPPMLYMAMISCCV